MQEDGIEEIGGVRGMTNGGTFVEICEKIIIASVCVCKFRMMDWVLNDFYVACDARISIFMFNIDK